MVKGLVAILVGGGIALFALPQIRHSIAIANVAFADGIARRGAFGLPASPAPGASGLPLAIQRNAEWLDVSCIAGGSVLLLAGVGVALTAAARKSLAGSAPPAFPGPMSRGGGAV